MNIHLWKKELGGKNNSLHIINRKKNWNMTKFVSIILLLYIMVFYAYKVLFIVFSMNALSWWMEMVCHFISFVFVVMLIHSNEEKDGKNGPFNS